MTILNALKKLHKKMTGQDTNSKTIGGVLDSMQENYTGGGASGGGSSLPDMTGQNGKFLTNNGTAASWGDVPSGALVATLVYDSDEGTYSLDDGVSFADIFAAVEGKRPVFIFVEAYSTLVQVFTALDDGGEMVFAGGVQVLKSRGVESYMTVLLANGTWTVEQSMQPILPSVSAPFNGMVLGVRDGSYTLTDLSFIVHMTVNLSGGTAYITDGKTIADIIAVAAANPFVYAEFPVGTGYGRLQLCGWDDDTAQGEKTVAFGGVSVGAKGIFIYGENDGTSDTFTVTTES